LANGSLQEIPQQSIGNGQLAMGNENPATELKHAPKLFTETCKIDWNQPVAAIHNLIRGLSPYPAAFTYLNDKSLKIYKAKKEAHASPKSPGSIETDNKTYLKFAAKDGYIQVIELQLEGKKRMNIGDFLRGNPQTT
jgi:methionyl-tRNA formyltransferase